MRPPSRRERIAAQLADLKMPGALEALDEILAGVEGGGTTAVEAVERLLAGQITLRNSRRLEAAMRSSRLPCVRTLADFDFAFQPSVKREQVDALHELGFLERRENVVFLGPPGIGKTPRSRSGQSRAAIGPHTSPVEALGQVPGHRSEVRISSPPPVRGNRRRPGPCGRVRVSEG